MPSTLHITNGDAAADILKASAVLTGDVLPWRDPMHHGPFPAGLSLEAASSLRAQYLSGPGLSRTETMRGFRLRDQHLRAAATYEKIILWFEHDVLDQLQLLQILSWLHTHGVPEEQIALICIDSYPGVNNFRGLGQLTASQMESLLPRARPVTKEQFALAATGWQAFCAPTPEPLMDVLAEDTSPLPFLAPCLQRYCEEFPWSSDGVTRSERHILQSIAEGNTAPERIMMQTMAQEQYLFAGDWRIYTQIAALVQAGLLACGPEAEFCYPPHMQVTADAFAAQELSLTLEGEAVLAGEQSACTYMQRDEWLGGVYLCSGTPIWLWDADRSTFELSAPQHVP